MTIEHGLHYRAPDEKSFRSDSFTKLTITPKDLLSIPQEQFRRLGYTGLMQLESVYQKIADYSPEFLLFTRTTRELALLAHPQFIGKPEEKPVPLLRMIDVLNSEHYFYPIDNKFVGRMQQQLEILDLAMPYVNMRIWEQSGYSGRKEGQGVLHIETELDFEYQLVLCPEYREDYLLRTRTEILQDLEFLLSFIPRERSPTINLNSLQAPSSPELPKARAT